MVISEKVHGTIVTIVLDIDSGSFNDESRWKRAERMVRYARGEGRLAVICGNTIRASNDRGVSFAAQLEQQLENHSGLVFVPLQNGVYIAEFEEGLVYSESVDDRDTAERKFQQHSDSAIIAKTPERQDFAFEYEDREVAISIDPRWQYRPLLRVLAEHRLPHAYHSIPIAAAATILLLVFLAVSHWQRIADDAAEKMAALRLAQQSLLQRQRPPLASAQLSAWASLLQGLRPYRAHGLNNVTLEKGTARLQGSEVGQSRIARLISIANAAGHTLQLRQDGWHVPVALEIEAPRRLDPVDVHHWFGESQTYFQRLGAQVELYGVSTNPGGTEYHFSINVPGGRQGIYAVLAERFAGVPAEVTELAQYYKDALPDELKLDVTVWGI